MRNGGNQVFATEITNSLSQTCLPALYKLNINFINRDIFLFLRISFSWTQRHQRWKNPQKLQRISSRWMDGSCRVRRNQLWLAAGQNRARESPGLQETVRRLHPTRTQSSCSESKWNSDTLQLNLNSADSGWLVLIQLDPDLMIHCPVIYLF